MNNASTRLYSPYSGRIIGMARNQVVMPGFAVFHVGIQTDENPANESGADDPLADDPLADNPLADNPLADETGGDDYVDGMSE